MFVCVCVVDLDAPRDLQTEELTDESITLEWKNSEAQVDNYRIKYGPLSGGEHRELLFPPGPKDMTKAKITGTIPPPPPTLQLFKKIPPCLDDRLADYLFKLIFRREMDCWVRDF